MSKFIRNIDPALIHILLKNDFFNSILKQEVMNGVVFAAIRNNRIDFYYRGGKLFSFNNKGFYTHRKYCGVLAQTVKDYIYIDEILKYHNTSNISEIYSSIKEFCFLYSGQESMGVSTIYHQHSFTRPDDEIVVLDIEIAFEEMDDSIENKKEQVFQEREASASGGDFIGRKSTDRIDFLLLDRTNCKLRFVEAKHYSNSEIKSENEPSVIHQLKRYDAQLKNKIKIEAEYAKYCAQMKTIFQVNLPMTVDLLMETKLLVFGFDQLQKTNNIHFNKLTAALKYMIYLKGSVKNLGAGEMKKLFYK